MDRYPEHEKLKAVSDKSQSIGEFIEWLQHEKGIELAEWGGSRGTALVPCMQSMISLLAEFFGIDRDILESEKLAMLEAARAAHLEREKAREV